MQVQVAVTKARATVAIETDDIPEDVYKEALILGLKTLVNRGTTKITKAYYPDADELKAAAMATAERQVELIRTGKIRFVAGKVKRASGAVMTEARRLAKLMVKAAMKEQGLKISHYASSEITKAANELLNTEEGKEILKVAESNVAERSAKPISIDLSAIMEASPELVAKAEARKSTLSAKQAGIPMRRSRGKGAGEAAVA